MADVLSYDFLSGLVLWMFIPSFVTKFLLNQYYGLKYSPISRPKEGSLQYKRHYQIVFMLAIIGYFFYCVVDFALKMKPSFYDQIGVNRSDVDEKLKSHFRHMIISLHPDKNPSADPSKFLKIKQIYEILNSEVSRSAYDCYGPDVIRNTQMSSSKSTSSASIVDYFGHAIAEWIGFYGASAVVAILSSMGRRGGMFWRFICLLGMASLDLYVLMRPSSFSKSVGSERVPSIFSRYFIEFWDNIPTYKKLALTRQLFLYTSMAISQVVNALTTAREDETVADVTTRAEVLSRTILSKEADNQLLSSLEPFMANADMRALLRKNVGKLVADLKMYELLDAEDRKRLAKKKD